MRSQLPIFLVSITFSLAAENQITEYPPVYAIKIEDSLQILQRVTTTNCTIWQNEDDLALYLNMISGQWEIIEKIGSLSPEDKDCYVNYKSKNLLFHQDLIQVGENPYSEGWYDVRKEISNVTLSLYALEECVTYAGAYVESEFDSTSEIPIGNMMSCTDKEIITDNKILYLFTTKPQNKSHTLGEGEGEYEKLEEILLCENTMLKSFDKGTLELSSDDHAMILIYGITKCGSSTDLQGAVDISEALTHKGNNATPTPATSSGSEEEVPLEVVIGSVAGGVVAVLTLVVLSLCYARYCCKKKNKSGEPGHYGMASIDSNLQYGEEKEYYQYHYDQKQTRVVDENELYADYDQ